MEVWIAYVRDLSWEFMKENKKVRKQGNTLLTKKATKKQENNKESDHENKKTTKKENKNSTMKAIKKTRILDHFLGRVLVFLLSVSCFINSHL